MYYKTTRVLLKMKKIQSLLFLSLFLLLNGLYGGESSEDQQNKSEEVQTPAVLQLDPNWYAYFDVEPEGLPKRVEEVKSLLEAFRSQLESPEDLQQAEKRIREFDYHLDSLLLLKSQNIENPVLAWLPKEAYSFADYIEISDKIRSLILDIRYKNTEIKRFKLSANDYYQNLNNTYAKYLTLEDHSKEKFLKGLDVMVLGARFLYLEAEAQLAKQLMEIDELMLARYRDERDQMDNKLEFEVDLNEVEEETAKIQNELADVHRELIEIESQSVKTFIQEDGKDKSRLINQKLTGVLLKEVFLRAKLFFERAKSTLELALNNPEELDYSQNIEPIKTFRNNTHKQLSLWSDMIASEIDLLSQAMVKVNGEMTEDQLQSTHEKSLKIALSNRAFLDALNNKLFHIKLVLGLIDQNVIERQTVMDKTSYYFQEFWQWFSESFGIWFYYSLFDIAGVPVNLAGIFKAVLIVLVSVWISNLMGRALNKLGKGRRKVAEPTLYIFRRVFHYLILVVGILFALASIGLTMRNMAIILGAVGIGVGFGLQNIVNNFLSGLAVLFERNVKIGDYVELESGFLGRITEISVQNTTLHTFDGVDVLVPNSSLIASHVVNWTKKDPFQRLHIPFGVAYGTEQKKVSEVVYEAALKIPYTMRANEGVSDPEVWLVEFADSALNFELVVWVNIFKSRGRKAMKAEYLGEIELALKEHGIQIPFPQRDLHLKTIPEEGIHLTKK